MIGATGAVATAPSFCPLLSEVMSLEMSARVSTGGWPGADDMGVPVAEGGAATLAGSIWMCTLRTTPSSWAAAGPATAANTSKRGASARAGVEQYTPVWAVR